MAKNPVNDSLAVAFRKAVEDKTNNKKTDIKSFLFDKSKAKVKQIELPKQSKSKKDESKTNV